MTRVGSMMSSYNYKLCEHAHNSTTLVETLNIFLTDKLTPSQKQRYSPEDCSIARFLPNPTN